MSRPTSPVTVTSVCECQPTRCRPDPAEVVDGRRRKFEANNTLTTSSCTSPWIKYPRSPHFSSEIRQKCSRSLKSEVGKASMPVTWHLKWPNQRAFYWPHPRISKQRNQSERLLQIDVWIGRPERVHFAKCVINNVILSRKLSKMRFY